MCGVAEKAVRALDPGLHEACAQDPSCWGSAPCASTARLKTCVEMVHAEYGSNPFIYNLQ